VYSKSYFILDGHTHFWDGGPANQINRYGEGFIKCFYDYHANLSPAQYTGPLAHFERYSEEDMIHAESLIAALDCIFAAQAIINAAPRSRR
jgi:hypothetical protein